MNDLDALTLVIYGEARGEPIEGKVAVAMVVRNRVNADLGGDGKPDWWGEGYAAVCLKPKQFSCWDDEEEVMADAQKELEQPFGLSCDLKICRQVAAATIAGTLADNTRGATHYLTRALYDAATPIWAKDKPVNQIGKQVFLNA